MGKTKRRHMMAETRLLMEYLRDAYPDDEWLIQARLGRDPEIVGVKLEDDAERRWSRNVNRRADAVVITPTEIVVLEATMFRATDKVGRLQEYLLLAPATPELVPYQGRPLVGELVTGQDDPVARILCQRQGLRYVFREPEWMPEFWALYPDRRRRAPHSGMVQELAARQDQAAQRSGAPPV